MAPVRRIVLDVLKPHEPDTLELAERIADIDGVAGVNAVVVEVDREVQNIKLTIEGDDVDYGAVESTVDTLGASVHSIDGVVCGERFVEESETPQD